MLETFLREKFPNFPPVVYKPDFRQGIAQSWPAAMDRETMIREIGIQYDYDFERTFNKLIDEIQHQKAMESTK